MYGSRATPARPIDLHKSADLDANTCTTPISNIVVTDFSICKDWVDRLGVFQVPHSYFKHFYFISVLSSVFWMYQAVAKGDLLLVLCSKNQDTEGVKSMSVDQISLTWALLLIQGVRRLIESAALAKPSASKMSIMLWMLGIVFYIAMGIAVWVEGRSQLIKDRPIVSRISFSAPSLRTILNIPIFILASGIQHDCHSYLASLPRYSLPVHPLFNTFVCPHYTAECLIYLSLAFISAPNGAWINQTMLSAFIFTSVNLSITASSTKDWYAMNFGEEKVASRWKMLPGVW